MLNSMGTNALPYFGRALAEKKVLKRGLQVQVPERGDLWIQDQCQWKVSHEKAGW